jgi:hypothetical protein
MEFDFCLVSSWAEQSHRQMHAWGRELLDRGFRVAIVGPTPGSHGLDGIQEFALSEYDRNGEEFSTAREVESRYDIPSLDHLVFTERQYFHLSRAEALSRAVRLSRSVDGLFSEHSFERTLQIRGPEIHRLLFHYATEHEGGSSMWAGFSPFEGTFSLKTTLKGPWDDYRTIPYEEIPDEDRTDVESHIEQFRDRQRFYAHDDGDQTDDSGRLGTLASVISGVRDRDRPGNLTDQIREASKLGLNRLVNERLYRSVGDSRRACRTERYAFFPLQYPVESRLTVFSPQFHRQEYLVEYLARVLPSSMKLFVKPHPNHPGRPSPMVLRRWQGHDRVAVLNPDLNAHEAIARSEGVVVINNTVGFEALYYNKPLVVLGSALYSRVPAATPVEDLSALPETLGSSLATRVHDEKTVASIHSLREASYDGDRTALDEANVRTLVDSVLSFVETIE